MRILVIHQYYLAPGHPGGSRFNEFAKHWTAAGHQVTVLAGSRNYATGEAVAQAPGKLISREIEDGVEVWRCRVPESYSHGFRGRMLAFAGFTAIASMAALQVDLPDVVIATSPPLLTAFPGWLLARMRRHRVPLVFEIRDLWPESAVTTGVLRADAPLTLALYSFEKWACRFADKINVLTPAFEADLVQRGLAGHAKIAFVPNGADVDLFSPGPRDNDMRRELGWGDRFVVMYAGAHGRANTLEQLIEAAALLRHRQDILIACVGDGPERARLAAEATRRELSNIAFCGPQPKQLMAEVVNACDVGAAVLQRNPTFKTVYPNKVFDYMACERPTLLAIDGVARQLVVDQANAGVFAEPEDASAIASAILKLRDDPALRAQLGRNGRAWVLANATRDALAARYLDVLTDLVAKHG